MTQTDRFSKARRNAKAKTNRIHNKFIKYLIEEKQIDLLASNRIVEMKGLFLQRYTLAFSKDRAYIWKMKRAFKSGKHAKDIIEIGIGQLVIERVKNASILERINQHDVGEYIFLSSKGMYKPIFNNMKCMVDNSNLEDYTIWNKKAQQKFINFLKPEL